MSLYDKIFPPKTLTLSNGKQVKKPRSRAPLIALVFVVMSAVSIEVTGFDMSVLISRIKEFFVILDVSGLNRSKIVAKQIAHNAISGFDDMSTLKELAKMLEDVDDMIESYAGKDILEEPEAELEKYLSPTVEFNWKNITFTFLPHQIADLQKLIDALESTKPDVLGVAEIEQYKPFMETLAKYQKFGNVKNTGAAIHAMIKCTEQMFEDIGYTEDQNWVQLTGIFGSSAIPADSAEIIQEALKKMIADGVVESKNKWQAIEYWAADYLAGK